MKYKLGELGTVYSGGTPSTKNEKYWDGSISWITPKDLASYSEKYISRGERSITQEGLKNSSATIIPNGAVLMSSRAPIGYVVIASNDITTNQGFKSILCDESKCLNEYMYYWIKSNVDYIKSKSNGSTFKEISGSSFKSLDIDIPDLATQKKIVRILSALDQKIELNNQESKNLHKIIKTLYKDTVASINTKTKLAVLAKISSGKRPTSIEVNGNFSVVGARDIMGLTDNYNQEPGTIITGRVGTLGVVKRYPEKIWASDNTLIIDTKYKNFVECYLSSVDFYAYNRGSTQPLITQTDLNNFIIPFNEKECGSFENKTTPLRNKIFVIEKQNEELVSLRNTLLPKLMFGKINLDKVALK